MTSRIGAEEADQLIEQKLQRSVQLHEAMETDAGFGRRRAGDPRLARHGHRDGGHWPVDGAWGLSARPDGPRQPKHRDRHAAHAVRILAARRLGDLRGHEQEIEALERELSIEADAQARKVAVYGDMLKALRKEGCNAPRVLVDEVGRVDKVLRHSLNSFVHGGFQPLKRHSEGFPLRLVLQVIETSNAISTMAAALFAVLTADEGHRMSRLNALLPEFRDVLPELTIVQKHAPQR